MRTFQCRRCLETKPETDFTPTKKRKEGVTIWCRACNTAYAKEYRQRNPEVDKRAVLKYRAKRPEIKRKAHQNWISSNREKNNERIRNDRKRNPSKYRGWEKEKYKRNPWKVILAEHKRRAIYQDGDVTQEQIYVLFQTYPACCACGSKERLTIDHVVPLKQGGKHTYSNLQVLCHSCNAAKGARHQTDYRKDTNGF